jgi:hypothetical protein
MTLRAPDLAVARAGLWTLFAAKVVAVWGTQWDVQWHLTIGRDAFWIAPHVMIYSGVAAAVFASFGVLSWTTLRAAGGRDPAPGMVRFGGFTGTPGYHVAAWGILVTVLAAPIDDLWHRLFGLDVTLWSPPHLLGLAGGTINSVACWLIAREAYPAGSRTRLAGLVLAGAFVYGGIGLGLQPSIRIAYVYGGVRFFTYPILAALLVPLALVVTARTSGLRTAPALTVLVVLLLGLGGTAVTRAGFAWLQPVSFLAEEIAKDPTSPIAIAHEIARKNGTTPGTMMQGLLAVALLGAVVMSVVDARRRPGLASAAYGVTVFVAVGAFLARLPAFASSTPSGLEMATAAVVTLLAGAAGGVLAGWATASESPEPRASAVTT